MTCDATSTLQKTDLNLVSNSLFKLIDNMKDPRKKRGVRHNFHSIIKLVIFGFTARFVCLEHIVEYADGIWDQIKEPLGFTRDAPPDATTLGRVLKKVDILNVV